MNSVRVPANCLWQYLKKEHLDPDNKLTKKQWLYFVDESEYGFVEEVSELGHEYLAGFDWSDYDEGDQ